MQYLYPPDFSFSSFQIHAINVQLLAKLLPHYCITCCTFYHLSFKAKSSASSLVVTVMKCLIVHNEIFNWTNAMIVYVHAKLHMRKLDEAKPLKILKPRFYFWWCCNWSRGSCNIWLVMKTRKTQGILLNFLKQGGFYMQTELGYVVSMSPSVHRDWRVEQFDFNSKSKYAITFNNIIIYNSFFGHVLMSWNTWFTSILN